MILLGFLLAMFGRGVNLDTPTPDLQDMQASCAADGGALVAGRTGAYQCLLPQPDQGQACMTALDCDGYCVGGDVPQANTCSRYAIAPGCTTFLNDTGEESTICVD